jgi:hypothetical protein
MPSQSLPSLRPDDHLKPKILQLLDGFHEAVKGGWLLHVTIRARLIADVDVPRVCRHRQDNYGDPPQRLIPLQLREHVPPSVPGRFWSGRMTPGRGASVGAA